MNDWMGLLEHQRRQRLGHRVAPMSESALRADTQPSTMYAAVARERLNHQIHIRSTRMVWLRLMLRWRYKINALCDYRTSH